MTNQLAAEPLVQLHRDVKMSQMTGTLAIRFEAGVPCKITMQENKEHHTFKVNFFHYYLGTTFQNEFLFSYL